MKFLILSYITFTSFIQALSAHQCLFDAKSINENSSSWPFERYGKIFNIDPERKHFDFVKNTMYALDDPQKVIGRSRNCVHWSEDTSFTKLETIKDFSAIKKPVAARFFVGHPKEREQMSQGNAFKAATGKLFLDAKNTDGIKVAEKEVVGMFTPDSPFSGLLVIGDKTVKVTMAKRNSEIMTEQSATAKTLQSGYWSARITGAESDEKFVAKHIELTALPDPRAGDDPNLPRLLVIGDSISMNFGPSAKEALKGVVNYHRNEGNSFSSNYGIQYADYWLGDYTKKSFHWDVIHFNHGMHDLKQSGPDAPYATPLETYKANLRTQIAILKKTGAKLIFCTTTPVHQSSGGKYGRQKGAEVAFNKAALEVMKEYPEIQINDLCKVVDDSSVFDHCKKGWDVHYYKPEEQKVLGDAVALCVKKALKSKK